MICGLSERRQQGPCSSVQAIGVIAVLTLISYRKRLEALRDPLEGSGEPIPLADAELGQGVTFTQARPYPFALECRLEVKENACVSPDPGSRTTPGGELRVILGAVGIDGVLDKAKVAASTPYLLGDGL